MEKSKGDKKFSELRKRAYDFLEGNPEKDSASPRDIQQLVHELDTYRIELELQNEDLRQSQVELEKSRRRYADLYDFSPVAYLSVNKAGFITEANLTAAEMLGVTRDKLLNRPFSSFIVPEDQDLYYLQRKEMLKTGQRQSYDLRLKRQDGFFIHALLEAVLRFENGDSPGEILVAISDITLRKEAEFAKLRRLKERYRAIVMDQNDLICRFDPQGRISFVNDAYCRFFSVNHYEILGTNFLPNIHKDDLPLVREHFNNLTPLNPQKTIEHRVILPDGKTYWQQWCGRALFNE